MYGIYYQLIVYMIVVVMFKNIIGKLLVKAGYT